MELTAVILAAGEAKRTRSRQPTVRPPLCGRPLIAYALRTARAVAERTVVDGACRPEGVGDQRATAERVEHFRLSGAHPFRFPGGENDGGQLHGAPHVCPLS